MRFHLHTVWKHHSSKQQHGLNCLKCFFLHLFIGWNKMKLLSEAIKLTFLHEPMWVFCNIMLSEHKVVIIFAKPLDFHQGLCCGFQPGGNSTAGTDSHKSPFVSSWSFTSCEKGKTKKKTSYNKEAKRSLQRLNVFDTHVKNLSHCNRF